MTKLDALIKESHLDEREELQKKVDELAAKLHFMEIEKLEAVKKAGMIDRNLTSDNKHLRTRVHNLEHENALYKEKVEELENLVKVNSH